MPAGNQPVRKTRPKSAHCFSTEEPKGQNPRDSRNPRLKNLRHFKQAIDGTNVYKTLKRERWTGKNLFNNI